MSKAYWIARIDVHDPETYKSYVAAAGPAYARFGAKFLVRGGAAQCLEGEMRGRNVVVEFDSMEKALACYNSPEYQAALKFRQAASIGDIVLVEGP